MSFTSIHHGGLEVTEFLDLHESVTVLHEVYGLILDPLGVESAKRGCALDTILFVIYCNHG